MAIPTQQSLSGFIASDPQLTFTTQGDLRLYAKVGREHYQRNDDGTFTKLDTTFHDLVIYRRAAEQAYAAFAKGDRFVAEGETREYSRDVDGHIQHREEFVVRRIGHDTARTMYAVDRTRKQDANRSNGVDGTGQHPSTTRESPAASL